MSESEIKKSNTLPPQHLVRPEVMAAFQESVARSRDLLERLARRFAPQIRDWIRGHITTLS